MGDGEIEPELQCLGQRRTAANDHGGLAVGHRHGQDSSRRIMVDGNQFAQVTLTRLFASLEHHAR